MQAVRRAGECYDAAVDVTPLIADLNPAQREAVTAGSGPLLVLAGAGSGKTRVLTHRVAWLVGVEGVSPHAILAVTFTNKAAAEMRTRIERMLAHPVSGMWVGTFHGLSHRLLRAHWKEAGLPQSFQILDAEDQYRLIRRVLKGLNLDEGYWPPKQTAWFINGHKEEGRRPAQLGQLNDPTQHQLARVYAAYEETCRRSGVVDFAELLLRAYELIHGNEALRTHYQSRFRHVLVDEFQDTNRIQYQWLELFAAAHKNLFVVGDDDQCLVAGTRIMLADGSTVPIERIKPGDQVRSCYGTGDFRAARVTGRFRKKVRRALITLHTRGGRSLCSTPEHTHFAGYLLGETPQTFFLYLMYRRGVGYRLGTSQVYTRGQARPMVGFKQRALQEYADALWVIRTHPSENEARADETITCLQYGIPTLPFVARKGKGRNGLVHDPEFIRRVYETVDSTANARRLMRDADLDFDRPHHQPRGRNSLRHNVVVTLCADRRGRTPMHRILVVGNDPVCRQKLHDMGLSVRRAKNGSRSWRFETVGKDFGKLQALAARIARRINANMVFKANLSGRSLPFVQAAHVKPGMIAIDEHGQPDVVERVEKRVMNAMVYDLNIEGTHNFIANGLVTHNSIYGWRGARVENILKFEQDHPGTRAVRLEQNYRSTGTILKAANQVIAHNQGRLGKQLWTADPEGEPILLYGAYTDLDEAHFVVERIQGWVAHGRLRAEVAVLYRSNAQSRVLEERLIQVGMPYRVYGGLRFFERQEIKDALAYLRLMASRHNDPSFERVANVPTRGLGAKTLDQLREHAKGGNVSLWEAAQKLLAENRLPARAASALKGFVELIERLTRESKDLILADQVEHMLALSGLIEHYKKEKGEKAESRVENLEELISAARGFEHNDADGLDSLTSFLAHAALEAGEGEADAWEDCVQLMSLHSAKGLEFPLVFLTGLEEGLFPHQRSLAEPGRLEEERRLCYVGMTRAREQLVLSHAEVRRLHGQEHYASPSRFLGEIPSDLVQEIRAAGPAGRAPAPGLGTAPAGRQRRANAAAGRMPETAMPLGCRVRHETFGDGVVLHCEGQGSHARVQVNFEGVGTKWLVLGYARLQTL